MIKGEGAWRLSRTETGWRVSVYSEDQRLTNTTATAATAAENGRRGVAQWSRRSLKVAQHWLKDCTTVVTSVSEGQTTLAEGLQLDGDKTVSQRSGGDEGW